MANLQRELHHLAEADRHIREGQNRITRLRALIDQAQARGENPVDATAILTSMLQTLTIFERHRVSIASAVEHALLDDVRHGWAGIGAGKG